jgi:hypothetical protein
MNLDQIREHLERELVYRETMVGCLRRLLQEDCQDIDDEEVEKWAKLAEETTTGLDAVVGAAYEYLQMRVKGVPASSQIKMPEAPTPLPPAPPARAKPRGRCPIPDMNPPPF